MYAARIENGVVVDVGLVAPGQNAIDGWVASEAKIGIGYSYANGEFAAPPPNPAPLPPEISRIQLVRAMRAIGIWEENRAAIEAHPDWPYVTVIPRHDEFVKSFAAAVNADDDAIDAIWKLGATL